MKGIEYADISWNPVTGCSHYGNDNLCAVWRTCWAYRMAQRLKGRYGYDKYNPFKPTFHEDKITIPYSWHKPHRVDTCFMGDLFSYGIPGEWINLVLRVIEENPRHIFYLLTKYPKGAGFFRIPTNAWLGTTINICGDSNRMDRLIFETGIGTKYVSFEPLLEDVSVEISNECLESLEYVDWIIIGAQTNPEHQPKKEWVEHIIDLADDYNIPVFMKPNLKVGIPLRQEFPKC